HLEDRLADRTAGHPHGHHAVGRASRRRDGPTHVYRPLQRLLAGRAGRDQVDAADGIAGRPHLQLLRYALRESDRARLGGVARSRRDRVVRQYRQPAPRTPTGVNVTGGSAVMNGSVESNGYAASNGSVVIDCKLKQVYYGEFLAVRDSHVPIEKGKITGFIGPSGCGKSTVLRSLNRMNDLIHGFRFEGHVHFHGQDVYAPHIDPVVLRRYIGMVFQQPNPFQMSIFDNVAFGLKLNRFRGKMGDRVEQALTRAALWDEVKDKLKNNGLSLS